jgi:hypothetical protein
MTEKPAAASAGSSTVSLSRKPSNNQDIDSLWRRPQLSQVVTQFETRFDDIRILFQMDVLHDQWSTDIIPDWETISLTSWAPLMVKWRSNPISFALWFQGWGTCTMSSWIAQLLNQICFPHCSPEREIASSICWHALVRGWGYQRVLQ